MRPIVKVLMLLVILVIVLGFFRGWFSVSEPPPQPGSDKSEVTVSVDKGKIKTDVTKAKEAVKKEVKHIKDDFKSDKTSPAPAPSTPPQ